MQSPWCDAVARVTDDLDRRCLMSILRQYITPRIASKEHAALTSSGTYYVPKDGAMDSYRDYIKGLPRWVRPGAAMRVTWCCVCCTNRF